MTSVTAIDPGTTESAWVTWDGVRICAFAKESNELLLARILSPPWQLDGELVIEQVAGMGMAVGVTTFETVFWSGRFAQAFGRDFHRLPRMKVKIHLCGSARAKDGNIRQALIDRLGPPGTKKAPGLTYGISGDCWQALALGVTWWDTKRS